jgi:hypothetical protein
MGNGRSGPTLTPQRSFSHAKTWHKIVRCMVSVLHVRQLLCWVCVALAVDVLRFTRYIYHYEAAVLLSDTFWCTRDARRLDPHSSSLVSPEPLLPPPHE